MVQLRPVKRTQEPSSPLTGTRISGKTNSGCSPVSFKAICFPVKSRNSIHEMESESQPASAASSLTPAKEARLRVTKTVQPRHGLRSHSPAREAEAGAGATPPLGRRPAGNRPHFQEAQTVPRGATSAEGFHGGALRERERGIYSPTSAEARERVAGAGSGEHPILAAPWFLWEELQDPSPRARVEANVPWCPAPAEGTRCQERCGRCLPPQDQKA